MPEPERDIEKTLRAYAKKRREEAGAPAEMHPATRRLLQGEVARLRGKAQDKSGFLGQGIGRVLAANRVSSFGFWSCWHRCEPSSCFHPYRNPNQVNWRN